MTASPSKEIANYIATPFGTLHLEGIHIGRFRIDLAVIQGREAAINLQECILAALDETGRKRVLKHGTRYPQPLPIGAQARPLAREIEDHLEDMVRRRLGPKTVDATRRTLKFLLMSCGDISVARIDHKHIHEMWKLLRWAPKGLTSDPLLKGISFNEAIALGKTQEVPPLAPTTEERHRRFLVAFFNQLVRSRAIPSSPMAAFRKPETDYTIDPNKPIRLFDEDDLRKIFARETFIPWAKKPHFWWAPMIGLFTGARVNEVCQLKLSDIVEQKGVWCIAFQKTLDEDLAGHPRLQRQSRQSVKGKGSMRTIPIAEPLLQAGFLDFIEDMKATGHRRLFPLLSAGTNRETGETNARYSQQFIVDFGRYMKTLGFGHGVAFHTFRHTLITELDQMGIHDPAIATITGHSIEKRDRSKVMDEHYKHKKPLTARATQMELMEMYRPNVELPRYRRGQFAKWLADYSKFYP
ncbi:site-specific integrase [Stenotrophomonas indicatrix]|uniref:site-specific integrase n=1 Tax=Stenotrophomonas indicatrix TaxID=2045451 RepID=UPI002650FA7B|nr:site-specific integrase [Stenotrophomonas indicatrix]MDN8644787.1 site-specific integrase [Stenotrophomonas indicatrix]MDN8654230.1 site-specific integrase [Stenotrophomonas indicatrix]